MYSKYRKKKTGRIRRGRKGERGEKRYSSMEPGSFKFFTSVRRNGRKHVIFLNFNYFKCHLFVKKARYVLFKNCFNVLKLIN